VTDAACTTAHICSDLDRRDLLRMQFHVVPRTGLTWLAIGTLMATSVVTALALDGEQGSWLMAVASGLVLGVIAFPLALPTAVGAAFFFTMFVADARRGQLGRQCFTLTEDALIEENEAGTLRSRWPDVRGFWSTAHALYIPTRRLACVHTIPRRAFADDAAYETFARTLLDRIEGGRAS